MPKLDKKYSEVLTNIPDHFKVSTLRAITAKNSNAYTNIGTRSYLIGSKQLAIIDPGPNITNHFNNIIRAVGNSQLTHIILTHSHQDHCAMAIRLAQELKAEIYMYGLPDSSNFDLLKSIQDVSAPLKSIEKIQNKLTIRKVLDGDKIFNTEWCFEVIFTPGHRFDHICLAWQQMKTIFSGDHVMGWSSTIVAPPSGNMSDYISSLKKLLRRDENIYFPTHGEPILDAKAYVQSQLHHRKNRDEQILNAIKGTPFTPIELVPLIYKNLTTDLEEAAAQNVFASLIYLSTRGFVSYTGSLSTKTKFFVNI